MASGFSHAVAALSIGTCFYRPGMPKRVWLAGAFCSVLPDIDVAGFHFGVRYADFWGHRGFTHSLLFAALLATLVTFLAFRRAPSVIPNGVLGERNPGWHPTLARSLRRSAVDPPKFFSAFKPLPSALPRTRLLWIWTYLFLATASHGFLDAMTDGGLGVAFFSPFNNARYFFPWRPIRVSPIGLNRFFTERGLDVLQGELLWIWLPSALLAAFAWFCQRRRRGTP